MALIEMVDLAYGEAGAGILDDQSITLNRGELGILVESRNGAGGAILGLIRGEFKPEEGALILAGQDSRRMSHRQWRDWRRRTAHIFTEGRFVDKASAFDNVRLPLELSGLAAERARAVAVRILTEWRLAGCWSHFPDQLSAEQRARLSWARAMARRAPILLAEEPLAGLDAFGRGKALESLENEVNAGSLVALVTSDPGPFAKLNCQHQVYNHDGKSFTTSVSQPAGQRERTN